MAPRGRAPSADISAEDLRRLLEPTIDRGDWIERSARQSNVQALAPLWRRLREANCLCVKKSVFKEAVTDIAKKSGGGWTPQLRGKVPIKKWTDESWDRFAAQARVVTQAMSKNDQAMWLWQM